MPPKAPSRLTLALALAGCGPDTTSATSTETTSSDTSLESESGEHSDTTETGADEDRCGDGVLDPDEDCEPLGSPCDTCTPDCRHDPLPANEWSVELELVDLHAHDSDEHWHLIATGPAQRLAVRGSTIDGEPRLYMFTLAGEQLTVARAAEHGFDTMLDHAIGVDGDVALLGLVNETRYIRHMLTDGSFDDAIEVSPAPDQVAITTHGFVHLTAGGSAHAISFAGEPLWTRPGPYEQLGNADDRIVLHSLEWQVELVAGDGTEALVWDWGFYPLPEYSRLASNAAFMLAGIGTDGQADAYANVLNLWTGEQTETLLVTSPVSLHYHPVATALDARADGWPLLAWGRCVDALSPDGCTASWETGVGGPENLDAVDLHRCDLLRSTRIGADGGVFVITEQLDGSAALVRRATL